MNLLWINTILIYAFAGIAFYAAVSDIRRFKIPNLVPLSLLALYPFYVLTAPTPVPWMESLAIAGLVFAVGLLIFAKGWAGGGDIKFIIAACLWTPPHLLMALLLTVALAGGALSVFLLTMHYLRKRQAAGGDATAMLPLGKRPAPYGVAIACGCLVIAAKLLLLQQMIG